LVLYEHQNALLFVPVPDCHMVDARSIAAPRKGWVRRSGRTCVFSGHPQAISASLYGTYEAMVNTRRVILRMCVRDIGALIGYTGAENA
jgi:hypothetical protein